MAVGKTIQIICKGCGRGLKPDVFEFCPICGTPTGYKKTSTVTTRGTKHKHKK